MEKTIKLASVLLKCGLGGERKEGKGGSGSAVNLLMIVCVLPIMYFVFRGGTIYGNMLESLDSEGLVLELLLFALSVFIFGVGIVSCINSFYLSSNLTTLIVMPFTPGQITGAKFFVAAVYEYYISIVVLAPFLAGLGWAVKAPVMYWISAVLAVAFMPLPPLALAAIASMLIMRVIGASKHKEMTTVLGAIGVVVIGIIYQIVSNNAAGTSISDVEGALANVAARLQGVMKMFPDIPLFARALVKNQPLQLLLALGVVLLYLLVFWLVAARLYLAGALGMQEGGGNHKALSAHELRGNIKASKIRTTYTKKEIRTILRTPAYYLNCLFLTLGWPVILVVPMLFSPGQRGELESIENLLFSAENPKMFLFVLTIFVCAVTLFASALNCTANSSISREGQGYQIMKQLPIPYVTQLTAKRNAALIICWVGSGGYMIAAEIVLVLLGKFPWWAIPYSIVVNLLLLIVMVNLEMLSGIAHPVLSWESEGDAIKGKVNFILFIIGLILLAVVAYVGYGAVAEADLNPFYLGGIVVIGLLALATVTEMIFRGYGKKKMERL